MRYGNLNMMTTVNREELIDILRKNRAQHSRIVKEARDGYVAKAKEALAARMDQLASGKCIELTFHLEPPIDCTSVYDTAIRMLEMNVDDTVELRSLEFRNLVEDEWDWTSSFYANNKRYSSTANSISEQLGY